MSPDSIGPLWPARTPNAITGRWASVFSDVHTRRRRNNLLAQIWTGQHADISANDIYQVDLERALGSIWADTIIMPASSDIYFPLADPAGEVRRIPRAELRVLETDWGHVAGEGLNTADKAAIEHSLSDLLRR